MSTINTRRCGQRQRAKAISTALLWAVAACYGASAATAASPAAAPAAAAANAAANATRAAAKQRQSIVEGADGVPLNVIEVGDAAKPALVLIHGYGQSHHSFNAQLSDPLLTTQFHIVAYDLRGHGFSGKPWTRDAYVNSEKWAEDLQRVITATHLQKPVILGWSYGSLVVADYVRKYGTQSLAGIVLAGAYGGLMPPPPPPKQPPPAAMLAEMAHQRELQLSGDMHDRMTGVQGFARMITAKPMPAGWMADTTMMGMLTATEARRYMFERSMNNTDLVAGIDVPTLIVIGGKDPSTPEAQGRELAAMLKHGQQSFYPQSGHSAFAEFPERFDKELAAFVQAAQVKR